MSQEYKEWLSKNIPGSASHYSTGFNVANNICKENSIPELEQWTVENFDSLYSILSVKQEFIEKNKSGNGYIKHAVENYMSFLISERNLVLPPTLPFEDFYWRWGSKGPTEGLNNKEILFGVLKILVKHNNKKHATQDFYDDMEKLEKSLQSKVDLKRKIDKNLIENSGQYWKALGLIKSRYDGTIDVTELGLDIAQNDISNNDFVKWQISNFTLPNEADTKKDLIQKYLKYTPIKPLKLILDILSYLYKNELNSTEWYISDEELIKVIVPLSSYMKLNISDYVNHLKEYRNDKTYCNSWPNLSDNTRTIREYLLFLSNFGALDSFDSSDAKRYYVNDLTKELFKDLTLTTKVTISKTKASNIIYFGSPGTGKSNTVDNITKDSNVRKVTFHPEYDYHSFVGGYKPSMDGKDIIYKFVPQIFTNIYIEAWGKPEEHFYLQIEEINRGNCAEIFGDLFQLLDRDSDGSSKYDVDGSEELTIYLKDKLGENHQGIKKGKIKLPSNLSIIATMNTSDQSLFPMDSAFKRRWNWEYVKIDYKCTNSNFIIKLDRGNEYEWLKFLEAVNRLIFDITGSPDKQIGNWFINATDTNKIIDEKTFTNKVLFYLWNDIFKDEDESLFDIGEPNHLIYEDFFTRNENSELIIKIIDKHLKLENKSKNHENLEESSSEE
jgi:hypothetical protein